MVNTRGRLGIVHIYTCIIIPITTILCIHMTRVFTDKKKCISRQKMIWEEKFEMLCITRIQQTIVDTVNPDI